MQVWALIIFFHVGPMGDGDSNATTTVHGFETQALCNAAAKETDKLVYGTVKSVRSVCVRTK